MARVGPNPKAIGLLFGVLGGASISGQSGVLIRQQLDKLMGSMNKTPFKIRVGIEPTSVKDMKDELDKVFQSTNFSQFTIDLRTAAREMSTAAQYIQQAMRSLSNNSGSAPVAQAKELKELYRQITAEMNRYYATKQRIGVKDVLGETADSEYQSLQLLEAQQKNMLSTLYSQMQAYQNLNGYQDLITRLSQKRLTLESMISAVVQKTSVTKQKQQIGSETKQLEKYKRLLTQVTNAQKKWTAASQADQKELGALRNELGKLMSAWDTTGAKDRADILDDISKRFSNVSKSVRSAGRDTKSFWDIMKDGGKAIGVFLTFEQVFAAIKKHISQMIQSAIKLEDAMTQLRVVTQSSESDYAAYSDSIAKSSKKIGASITDLIDSTTTYARLGYNLDESAILAEYTAMIKNVGDIDINVAQDAVTAIIKAYNMQATQIESVLDKLVTVGNKFPISASQLAEGMNNAAAVLSAAGNSFEESVALLTAANTVVQDISKASTGLRTIAARIRNTKAELDDLGETMTEADYEKLVRSLTKYHVSLTTANGEFKSTYDIMKQVSEVWEEMSTMEQAGLAETLAGNRQQAIFYSLIGQFKEASGSMDAMRESAGALEKATSIYMDSMTAHIAQFKAAYDSLADSIISSGLVNFVVDSGRVVLEILRSIVEVLDSIGGGWFTLSATVATISALSISLNDPRNGIGVFGKSMVDLVSKTKDATSAMGKFRHAIGTLGSAFAGIGIEFKAALAIIGVAAALYSTYTARVQKSREEVSKLVDEYQDLSKSTNDAISTLNSLQKEYNALAAGVDEYGKNISLSADDYERYQEIVSQVLDISPSLIAGYNAEGEAIARKNGLIEESIRLTKEEQKVKAWELTRSSNIHTAAGTHKEAIQEAKNAVEDEIMGIRERLASAVEFAMSDKGDYILGSTLAKEITNPSVSNTDVLDWFLGRGAGIKAAGITWSRDDVFSTPETQKYLDGIDGAMKDVDALSTALNALDSKLNSASSEMRDILKAVPVAMDDYWGLSSDQLAFLNQYIDSIDLSFSRTDKEWDDLVKTIQHFTSGLLNEDGILGTVNALAMGKDAKGASLTLDEYTNGVKELRDELDVLARESDSGAAVSEFANDYLTKGTKEIDSAITHLKNILGDEFEGMIGGLSIEDILLAYQITASPNSLTIDQLREKLELLKLSVEFDGVLDFAALKTGFEKLIGEATNLGSAMKKAEEGTKLTEHELHKLILEYPDLAKANISATKTAEEQYGILSNLMEGYAKQFQQMIQSQLDAINMEMGALADIKKFADEYLLKDYGIPLDRINTYEYWEEIGGLSTSEAFAVRDRLQTYFSEIGKDVQVAIDDATGLWHFSVDGVPVNEWVQKQGNEFQKAWDELDSKLQLDFKDFFTSDTTSSTTSTTNPFVDDLNKILDLTKKLVEWELKNQVDALEKEKDAYQDIIDQKKKILDLAREESERNDDLGDRLNEIAKLQSRIDQLALDDSREAQAQKYQLEEELAEKQKDLAKVQNDYAYDKKAEALDKEANAFADAKDKEIAELEKTLSSEQKLYDAAIARIDAGWDSLFTDLLTWNYQYGSDLQSTIVSAWDAATEAVGKYGAAINGVVQPGSFSSAMNASGMTGSRDEIGNAIVAAMKRNSASWLKATSDSERRALEENNKTLAKEYGSLLGNTPEIGMDGVWRVNGAPLYEIKKHHTGGVAGGSPTLKQDEVLAILQKGEPVLSHRQEKGLFEIIDFAQVLSERLGKVIDGQAFRNLVMGTPAVSGVPALAGIAQGISNSMTFAPVVTVHVNHTGKLDDGSAKRFGSIAADSVLRELNDTFMKRGIKPSSGLGGASLK